MKVFYHNDLDGRCAGAIVYKYLMNCEDDGTGFEYIEMDYNFPVPIEKIRPNEKIIIIDFSFKPEIMEQVLKITSDIIWIDHHKTNMYDYSVILEGKRDVNFSGCELTWKYFFSNKEIPKAVLLIGDRDTWKWKYGKNTANFTIGMAMLSHDPKDSIWEKLLNPIDDLVLAQIEDMGEKGTLFRDQFCKDYTKSYGFETEFEGHKAFACNLYDFGSLAFGDRIDKYSLLLSFVFDGSKWQIGLYSKTIDVGEIAKRHGGGGHTGASGFLADELPFKKNERR